MLEEKMEKQILNALYQKDYPKIYDLYIWSQYQAGDDIWIVDFSHPLHDNIKDAIHEEMKNKQGFIYVAEHPVNHYYKVGMTRQQPLERMKSLNQSGMFDHLILQKAYPVNDIRLEKLIHRELSQSTPFIHKEFFKTSLHIIDNVINQEIQEFNDFLKVVL